MSFEIQRRMCIPNVIPITRTNLPRAQHIYFRFCCFLSFTYQPFVNKMWFNYKVRQSLVRTTLTSGRLQACLIFGTISNEEPALRATQ